MFKFSTALLSILLAAFCSPAFSQAMSPEEIANAVEMMRKSGAPEESIQKFLEGMALANQLQENMQTMQEQGMSEENAAMRAMGMNENDVSEIEGLSNFLGDLDAAAKKRRLNTEIAEFNRDNAGKNDVSVSSGELKYQLKLLECNYQGESYYIYAEGAPYEAGKKGPNLSINRSGPYASGDSGEGYYLESLLFVAADFEVNTNEINTDFDGRHFSYSSQIQLDSGDDQSVEFSITLDCP